MSHHFLARSLAAAALAALSACSSGGAGGTGGSTGCGTQADACTLSTDCCPGFACLGGRCAFQAGGGGSAGTSNGEASGGSSSGSAGSTSGGTTASAGSGTSTGSAGSASAGSSTGGKSTGGSASTTGATTSAGSSTGGNSNGTGSTGGTTGAQCSNTAAFSEYTACTTTADCACPLSCVSGLPGTSGPLCVQACSAGQACPAISDSCSSGGYCLTNACSSPTSLCTDVTAGDGTCLAIVFSGTTYDVCTRGGSIPIGGACSTSAFTAQEPPVPSSSLCAPGSLCDSNSSSCQPVCVVGAAGGCAAGQSCNTNAAMGLASTFGLCEPSATTGGTTGGGTTGGTTGGGTGGFQPAAHQAFDQMPDNGGPVVATPNLITFSYVGFESATYPVASYGDWLVTSPWLQTVGPSFGVGLGTHLDVQLPGSGPTSTVACPPGSDAGSVCIQDSDVQAFIWSYVADAGSAIPLPSTGNPSNIYMIYYPENVIVLQGGGQSCTSFGGYHGSFGDLGDAGTTWVYAVIPTCPNFDPNLTPTQIMEVDTSHEFIEACTDPEQQSPGYYFSSSSSPWAFDYPEVGDVCDGAPNVTYAAGGNSFTAQEVWSNPQAAAGNQSPCAPQSSGVYFNVSPVAQLSGATNGLAVVPAGTGSVSFALTGWSSAPTGSWTVYAYPTVGTFTLTSNNLAFTAPGQTAGPGPTIQMSNGGTATLTVTLPSGLTSGTYAVVELASSQDPNFATYDVWPVVVGIQ